MMSIESSYNALFFAADSMHCWAPRPFFCLLIFREKKTKYSKEILLPCYNTSASLYHYCNTQIIYLWTKKNKTVKNSSTRELLT